MIASNFRDEAKLRPILWFFAFVWAIEAGMNAVYGYRRGGENFISLFYGGLFLSIAVIAAWLSTRLRGIKGQTGEAWARRILVCVPIAFCVLVSQVAGWSVAGVTLADGQVARDVKASKGANARSDVERLRAQQKQVGVQVPPAEIEAKIKAELGVFIKGAKSTLGEATKDCADPGWAPSACKRVAALRIDLERARQAATLPEQIAAALKRLEAAPQTAEGRPDLEVLARIFNGADQSDLDFWYRVVLVGIIGFFANFGFALAGMQDTYEPAPVQPAPRYLPRSPYGVPQPPQHPVDPSWGDQSFLDGTRRHAYGEPAGAYGAPSGSGGPAAIAGPSGPSATGQPANATGGGSVSNTHIYVGGQTPAGTAAGISAGLPAPVVVPQSAHGATTPAVAPAGAAPAPVLYGEVLPAPAAPDRPVDRSAMREMTDQLAVFKAACLIDAQGQVAPAEDVWQRYRAWARDRAVARDAFLTMFELLATKVEFGGVPHFRGVALRPAASAVA